MKASIIFLTGFILFSSNLFSQPYFQKIISDPVVNTANSNSFSAWGDYDNDNYVDLVVSAFNDNCESCSYLLLFFRNNGDGSFTRIFDNSIAQSSVRGTGLAWGDYDNDGNLDLFVCGTISSKNKLFHNEGNGNFTEVLEGEIVNEINSSQSCGWSDYNKDGWIDLFVTNRYGRSNRLYKNNGDGTFTKILSGSIVNDISESRGCAWGDYDNDGWPDLFVVNYSGLNDFLYHNNQDGTFTRIQNGPMVNDHQWGSSCQWVDYDNNGFIDLFVTNTGGSNVLYYNHGNGNFTIKNSLLSDESSSFGLSWGDFTNDGLTDVFVCNPFRNNTLFQNNGASTFTKVQNDIISQEGGYSVGSSYADYNNDGKLDVFVTNRNSTNYNYLYKNVTPNGNYLSVKLKGCKSNSFGIGARIKIVYNNTVAYRDVSGNSSWSQNATTSHFGLGSAAIVDSLIVYWPSDTTTILTNVQVNNELSIKECPLEVIGINNNVKKNLDFRLEQNYPNPFNPVTKITYEIPSSEFVSLKVYDILGNEVSVLVNGTQQAGAYEVFFDSQKTGKMLSSGIYFYKLEAGNFTSTQRMTLLK